MLHHDRRAWLTQAAPGPDDVIWGNLGCAVARPRARRVAGRPAAASGARS